MMPYSNNVVEVWGDPNPVTCCGAPTSVLYRDGFDPEHPYTMVDVTPVCGWADEQPTP